MIYDLPKYLTPAVLAEVMATFSWPVPCTLKPDFDGIEVDLPAPPGPRPVMDLSRFHTALPQFV